MSDYFQCEDPYPYLAKVWDYNDPNFHFTIVIDKPFERFLDHNGYYWDQAAKVDELDFINPIKMLEGNEEYDHLTVPPQEQDFR